MHKIEFCIVAAIVAITLIAKSMAGNVDGRVRVRPVITHTDDAALTTTPTEALTEIFQWELTGGTSTNQMNQFYNRRITLAGGAKTNLDVYGALKDSFGKTLFIDELKFLAIVAADTNSDVVAIGAADSNPLTNFIASGTLNIEKGASMSMFSPLFQAYAVSNGVNDTLTVTNFHATSNATFDIYIGGVGP